MLVFESKHGYYFFFLIFFGIICLLYSRSRTISVWCASFSVSRIFALFIYTIWSVMRFRFDNARQNIAGWKWSIGMISPVTSCESKFASNLGIQPSSEENENLSLFAISFHQVFQHLLFRWYNTFCLRSKATECIEVAWRT